MRDFFLTVLFFIFLTLKLTGHIDWSWWWVFSPFWMPVIFAVLATGWYYATTTPEQRRAESLARLLRELGRRR